MNKPVLAESLLPLAQTPVAPLRCVATGEGRWFLDFGRAAFGTVEFRADAPDGRDIEVHLGEVLAAPTAIERNPGGSRRYRRMLQRVRPGCGDYRVAITPDQRNTSPGAILMPPEVGEVMPFRYCELVNYPGTLVPGAIRQIAVHYPFDETASSFHCSSQVLNDVWDLCKYSIKATSFAGVYVDGDRERIPYEGDAYINQLGHYCVDRQYAMARHTARFLMRHPTWPMEWHLHMPLIAWADYLYTGNAACIREFYGDLVAKTLIGLARADGLIVEDKARMTPEFCRSIQFDGQICALVDWPPARMTRDQRYGERDNHDMRPVNAVPNAFHYQSLNLMAQIAEAAGHGTEVVRWRTAAKRVYASFNAVFWNEAAGLYIDGEGSTHTSLHTCMFALAFGLVPAPKVAQVVAFIKSRGMACSVYGAQFLLDALYAAGAAEYALSLMTATHDRSWAHMCYTVGSTITLEAWDNRYKENQDYNHAWGAAPANLIPRQLMGIQPLTPGCSRMRIKPQPGSLSHATLQTPIPQGPITLAYARPGGRWRVEVALPDGVAAELWIPEPGRSRVCLSNGAHLGSEGAWSLWEIRGQATAEIV